ncbi:MAG: tripartite tricarboxylate transporter TctB family protein [Spirochaetales bacterium]|jgi:hypothetical protein|nr:tripartite tricarboxylate transporter TctB family protein [Spirochaetales bacterium]
MQIKQKDLLAGIILMIVSVIYFMMSFQIRLTNIDRRVGSRLFPQICGILMFVLSGTLIVKSALGGKKNAAASAREEPREKKSYRSSLMVFGSFALYILIMDAVGFSLATAAYLFSQMIVLRKTSCGKRRILLYALMAICATAAIYFLFNNVFYLVLPRGMFF